MTKVKKKVSFVATVRFQEMVDEIKEQRGYGNDTQVYYEGVATLHKDTFPPYLRNTPKTTLDPVAKEKAIMQAKKISEEVELEKQKQICYLLEGEVDGMNCNYFKYSGRQRYDQSIPLTLLNEGMIRNQYSPNKETVKRLQAEGKTNYESKTN